MDKVRGFKTFVFGAALVALAALSNDAVQAFIADNLAWLEAGTGTIVIILRALTNSPIFKK